MTGGMVVRPLPEMKLTTPLGSAAAYTSIVSTCARPPRLRRRLRLRAEGELTLSLTSP